MLNVEDITGKRFERLTVIERVENDRHRKSVWKCRCDCGKEIYVNGSHLKSGHTKSCGCYSRDYHREHPRIKHGLVFDNGKKTRLYRIWAGIKNRCYNKKDEHYRNYGERGITVCDEWRNDYKCFYDWAMSNGYRKELTVDRIDVNGNYEPSNCRWASNKEQSRNKRNAIKVNYNGNQIYLKELSEITGVGYQTLYWRYTHNIPLLVTKGNKNE